ncbi:hypothetical protein NE237_016679 [Protea cynaroides]|uniref:Uncharacterized protein n=1 Tax=Protea cynaroides TaxID=273540 RepID=A0A9Q0HFF4_9MAGN|nr:hypothetical protein NE237_016679 [Protea cynaroides]
MTVRRGLKSLRSLRQLLNLRIQYFEDYSQRIELQSFQVEDIKQDYDTGKDGITMITFKVRFGILEAGAYGVTQSREQAFIWAASPEEWLPEWPGPMHVLAGPDLKISLPGNVQYAAVRNAERFGAITVKDTIGELPPVKNGACDTMIDYQSEPVSWFQKRIRGNMLVLYDHISK